MDGQSPARAGFADRAQAFVRDLPPLPRAVCLMIFAALMFQSMNAVIRHVAHSGIHPFEVAFFRNIFGLVALAPLILRNWTDAVRTNRFHLHLLRGVVNVVSMLCFFYSVSVTPLADVASLGFTLPLFVTVYAAILLKERLRARRLIALAIGIVGALMIVRPGSEDMNQGTLIVLFGTAAWGAALMIIKVQSRTESPLNITVWSSIMLALLSAIPAFFVWRWPDATQLLWMGLTGVLGTAGTLAMAQALRMTDASAIMPFDFVKFIWAALIGYLAFGELPDAWVWIGGVVIFCSTVYLTLREAHLAREGRLRRDRDILPEA
ncbi:DMT family transporter [Iodidimonas sp. SYSU 1G8]|uniref:DMT family transporter n=1 Tax=Iodidimonas sp. SYSU 1G8 TaxID=3133967 RepID=UPI0031FE9F6B